MSIKSLSLLCALSHLSPRLFNIPIFMIENCELAQHSEVENKNHSRDEAQAGQSSLDSSFSSLSLIISCSINELSPGSSWALWKLH